MKLQRKHKIIGSVAGFLVAAVVVAVILVFVLNNKDELEVELKLERTIKNGKIRGSLEYTNVEKKVFYAYRGIPYAKPPLGDLRFAEPQPADKWDGVLNATQYSAVCTQMFAAFGTEDCLYLNVFTRNPTEKNVPVMVWLYGGAFEMGYANDYFPDYFLDEDVVIVTFNYRVGIFGFYSTEDEIAPGNWGLKDQLLALKWVQENIEVFGGDPNKVTIFGQSAGAASISYLLQSKLTKGLYRAAIMQSGTTLNLWALSRGKTAAMRAIGKVLGINNTDDSSILIEEMRKVNATTLGFYSSLIQVLRMAGNNPLKGLLFSPSVEPEHDTAIITGKSFEKLQNGEFEQVPCMVGVNSEEMLLFTADFDDLILLYFTSYQLFQKRLIPQMNLDNKTEETEVGEQIMKQYFPSNPTNKTMTRYFSEHEFERAINKYVEIVSNAVDVYYYYFSFVSENSRFPDEGAKHSDEISYLWGRGDNYDLSKKMVKMWTNFAKYLNPTPESDSVLENIIWSPYKTSKSHLIIGDKLQISENAINSNLQFWEDLYEQYGKPPYDTY